jgi:hypothetical protein
MFASDAIHCCQENLPDQEEQEALHNLCTGAYSGELALVAASAVTDWSFLTCVTTEEDVDVFQIDA